MAVAASSLSVAMQGIADYLQAQFDSLANNDVKISVANPQRASELAKTTSNNDNYLNIFAYRVAPSGFHAGAGMGDTHFLRVFVLLTPFPSDSSNSGDDADLRILGHAIRALQSNPVLPVAPKQLPPGNPSPAEVTVYRLETIMLAPAMEEINHIWTTQGGELAYRLSAVYEFALVPVDPLERYAQADPPTAFVLDTASTMDGAKLEFVPLGEDSHGHSHLKDKKPPPPTNWQPVQMFVKDGKLINELDIPASADKVACAVAGPVNEDVSFEIVWTIKVGSTETQSTQHPIQKVQIAAPRLDATNARFDLKLKVPANATGAAVHVHPKVNGAGQGPYGNALTLKMV